MDNIYNNLSIKKSTFKFVRRSNLYTNLLKSFLIFTVLMIGIIMLAVQVIYKLEQSNPAQSDMYLEWFRIAILIETFFGVLCLLVGVLIVVVAFKEAVLFRKSFREVFDFKATNLYAVVYAYLFIIGYTFTVGTYSLYSIKMSIKPSMDNLLANTQLGLIIFILWYLTYLLKSKKYLLGVFSYVRENTEEEVFKKDYRLENKKQYSEYLTLYTQSITKKSKQKEEVLENAK